MFQQNIWVTRIKVKLLPDVIKLLDWIEFEATSFSHNPAKLKKMLYMHKSEVWGEFTKIAGSGKLYILFSGKNTKAVQRLQGLFREGKKVFRIKLYAEERKNILAFNLGGGSSGPINMGFELGIGVQKLMAAKWNRYAALKLTDAKILGLIPIGDPKTTGISYSLILDGSENPDRSADIPL
jgi:hypothetical protein